MPRFDPDDDYGIVSPPSETGAAFYQRGCYFDHDYNHIDFATGNLIERYDAPKEAPKAKPKANGTHQPRKSERAPIVKIGVQDGEPVADDTAIVDLDLWYTGEKKYQWFKAKRAAFERFGSEPQDASELRAMIEADRKVAA